MNQIKSILKSIFPRKVIFNARKTVNSIRYKGDNVHCPCCQKGYKKFLPFPEAQKRAQNTKLSHMIGMGLTGHVYCPGCYSTERHRLLRLFHDQKFPVNKQQIHMLHFAPEETFASYYKSFPNIKYVTTDLFDPNVDVKADITDLPFEDNSFDAVICSHVLEHIPDDHKAMTEIYRILRSDCWAIFCVPMDPSLAITYEDASIVTQEEREKMFGQSDHVRIYGIDFQQRLSNAGFNVKIITFVDEFSDKEIQKYGLERNDRIYLSFKS